jgi:hypothetical protein
MAGQERGSRFDMDRLGKRAAVLLSEKANRRNKSEIR